MKLSDFYFVEKHQKGTMMPIPLPNGKDSGEWLQVVGPDCDAAVRAGRAYTRAVYTLKDSLSELDDQCKEKGDWTLYNNEYTWAVEKLNHQMAKEIVTGWSFDEPFTLESLENLLLQYRGLSELILAHHTKSKELLLEK